MKKQDEATEQTAETQPRYKSWALWSGMLGAVGLVLQTSGLMQRWGLTDAIWNAIVTSLGTILTLFGLVNNPTDPNHL